MKKLIALALMLCCALPAARAEGAAPARTVESLWFTYGGYNMPVAYNVFRLDGASWLCIDRVPARAVGPEVMEGLTAVAERYDLAAWDGFDGENPGVLDGTMFSFSLTFSDATTVQATGDNRFPAHYHEAAAEIEALLRAAWGDTPASLPGTYRYEGDGFGGDFTVTLEADGTFTYSEGPLSSWLGYGEWFADAFTLALSEDSSPGHSYVFIPAGDALVFLAEESSAFPRIRVPDHGRFVKTAPAGENGASAEVP